MTRRRITTIAALAAMVAMIQTAQASFLLGDLVANNGSITVGDKTFSNFGYVGSLAAGPALAEQAAGLTVTAVRDSETLYHLDFAGALTVNNLLGANALLGDIQLSYTVTVNAPNRAIFMIDQSYTPNGLPVAGNQIIIGETVRNNSITYANSTLTLNPADLSDPIPEAGDSLMVIPPQIRLNVIKDILIATAPGQLVGLSDVQQSFHQVPEPTTMIAGALLLLPFGASTLRMLRRRTEKALIK